jgi:hypothetical protein
MRRIFPLDADGCHGSHLGHSEALAGSSRPHRESHNRRRPYDVVIIRIKADTDKP